MGVMRWCAVGAMVTTAVLMGCKHEPEEEGTPVGIRATTRAAIAPEPPAKPTNKLPETAPASQPDMPGMAATQIGPPKPGDLVMQPVEAPEVKAPSGLAYQEIKEGTGRVVGEGSMVTVHYTGWLKSNGQMFDSSRLPGRGAFDFTIGQGVIQGWTLGVQGMHEGGKRRLIIPPSLGYGKGGSPPKIPGDATLVFDVEVIKVR